MAAWAPSTTWLPNNAATVTKLHRADVYALGATLFKLLSGQAPYSGPRYKTALQNLRAVGIAPIESIEEHAAFSKFVDDADLALLEGDNAKLNSRFVRELTEGTSASRAFSLKLLGADS